MPKLVLVVTGTVIGTFGLTTLVYAWLFRWAADQFLNPKLTTPS